MASTLTLYNTLKQNNKYKLAPIETEIIVNSF